MILPSHSYWFQSKILYQNDMTAPTISSISFTSTPQSASYSPGETITITTVWSETVVVTSTPRIPVLGLSSKNFTYSSGSGSNTLNFTYVVANGDSALSGVGLTANSFDISLGTIIDRNYNVPNYNFGAISISTNQRVGSLSTTISIALAGNVSSATYRVPITITATVSAPGKVSFFFSGKLIAGCKNVSTVTLASITATCNWKPSLHSLVTVKANLSPNGSYTPATTSINVPVLRRTTPR